MTDRNDFQENDFLIHCVVRRSIIVTKYTKDGYPYDEPPYTEEELDDLYRRIDGGPIAIVHSGPAGRRNKSPAAKDRTTTTSSIDNDRLVVCAERRRTMVRKYTKAGNPYDEPPYTEKEIDDFDRLMNNASPVAIVYSGPAGDRFRAPPPPKPKPKQDDDLLE